MASSASTKPIFSSPIISSSQPKSSKSSNLSFLSSNTFGVKPNNNINNLKLSSQQHSFVVKSVLKTVDQTKQTTSSNNVAFNDEKPTILVSEKLGEAGLQVLRQLGNVVCAYDLSPEDLCKKISSCDALIVRSGTKVTRQVFEAGQGKLKVVGRAGVGIDNVDLQAATEFGCLVVNAPTANTIAAAEHGIALLAAMARNVSQADASLKA
ncbi:D-3-phosphoglycerate dehydrogenase chloroplastic-like, partial [Trifolium pratense]